jgi:hypothetical protein
MTLLGAPLLPLFTALGTFPSALASSFGWCPAVAAGDHFLYEDLLEVLPTIDHVSRQVVQPGPTHVGLVNGEELDEEQVVDYPTRPTHEAVVFQANARICFAVILDDVFGARKHFGKHVSHTWLLNALAPSPSGLKLHPSWSL